MVKRSPLRIALALLLDTVVPPILMGLLWGSFRGFFGHPARVAAAVLLLLPALVMILFTRGYAAHERRGDEGRGFVPALNLAMNLALLATVYLEGHGIWVLPGGDVLRWAGVVVLAAGTWLRAGTMLELGSRFSLEVSAQENHRLQTSGFYRWVRHPSYLGVTLIWLGVAGVFRSWLWLALFPLMLVGLVKRMDTEERFLIGQLGDEYRAYLSRTARLVPGVY